MKPMYLALKKGLIITLNEFQQAVSGYIQELDTEGGYLPTRNRVVEEVRDAMHLEAKLDIDR